MDLSITNKKTVKKNLTNKTILVGNKKIRGDDMCYNLGGNTCHNLRDQNLFFLDE